MRELRKFEGWSFSEKLAAYLFGCMVILGLSIVAAFVVTFVMLLLTYFI